MNEITEEKLNKIKEEFKGNLVDYIEKLNKQVEQGEHYKHLYSSVKKQKDDVVEYIKNNDLIYNHDCGEKFRVLLRMLGEIDE